jgi:hypothetical protein
MKYVLIISSPRNYTVTILYQFPPLFTLTLHYVAAMFFIIFGKWEVFAAFCPEGGERSRKKLEERCRNSIIPRCFETLLHTHVSVLKIIYSIALSSNFVQLCF